MRSRGRSAVLAVVLMLVPSFLPSVSAERGPPFVPDLPAPAGPAVGSAYENVTNTFTRTSGTTPVLFHEGFEGSSTLTDRGWAEDVLGRGSAHVPMWSIAAQDAEARARGERTAVVAAGERSATVDGGYGPNRESRLVSPTVDLRYVVGASRSTDPTVDEFPSAVEGQPTLKDVITTATASMRDSLATLTRTTRSALGIDPKTTAAKAVIDDLEGPPSGRGLVGEREGVGLVNLTFFHLWDLAFGDRAWVDVRTLENGTWSEWSPLTGDLVFETEVDYATIYQLSAYCDLYRANQIVNVGTGGLSTVGAPQVGSGDFCDDTRLSHEAALAAAGVPDFGFPPDDQGRVGPGSLDDEGSPSTYPASLGGVLETALNGGQYPPAYYNGVTEDDEGRPIRAWQDSSKGPDGTLMVRKSHFTLNRFIGKEIQVGFHVRALASTSDQQRGWYLDEVEVRASVPDRDPAVNAITLPASGDVLASGTRLRPVAEIANNGRFDVRDASVTFQVTDVAGTKTYLKETQKVPYLAGVSSRLLAPNTLTGPLPAGAYRLDVTVEAPTDVETPSADGGLEAGVQVDANRDNNARWLPFSVKTVHDVRVFLDVPPEAAMTDIDAPKAGLKVRVENRGNVNTTGVLNVTVHPYDEATGIVGSAIETLLSETLPATELPFGKDLDVQGSSENVATRSFSWTGRARGIYTLKAVFHEANGPDAEADPQNVFVRRTPVSNLGPFRVERSLLETPPFGDLRESAVDQVCARGDFSDCFTSWGYAGYRDPGNDNVNTCGVALDPEDASNGEGPPLCPLPDVPGQLGTADGDRAWVATPDDAFVASAGLRLIDEGILEHEVEDFGPGMVGKGERFYVTFRHLGRFEWSGTDDDLSNPNAFRGQFRIVEDTSDDVEQAVEENSETDADPPQRVETPDAVPPEAATQVRQDRLLYSVNFTRPVWWERVVLDLGPVLAKMAPGEKRNVAFQWVAQSTPADVNAGESGDEIRCDRRFCTSTRQWALDELRIFTAPASSTPTPLEDDILWQHGAEDADAGPLPTDCDAALGPDGRQRADTDAMRKCRHWERQAHSPVPTMWHIDATPERAPEAADAADRSVWIRWGGRSGLPDEDEAPHEGLHGDGSYNILVSPRFSLLGTQTPALSFDERHSFREGTYSLAEVPGGELKRDYPTEGGNVWISGYDEDGERVLHEILFPTPSSPAQYQSDLPYHNKVKRTAGTAGAVVEPPPLPIFRGVEPEWSSNYTKMRNVPSAFVGVSGPGGEPEWQRAVFDLARYADPSLVGLDYAVEFHAFEYKGAGVESEGWYLDNIEVREQNVANDVGIADVVSPGPLVGPEITQPVVVRVRNDGFFAQKAVQVNYTVYDPSGDVVFGPVTAALPYGAPGDELPGRLQADRPDKNVTFPFPVSWTPLEEGVYTLVARTELQDSIERMPDENPRNDVFVKTIVVKEHHDVFLHDVLSVPDDVTVSPFIGAVGEPKSFSFVVENGGTVPERFLGQRESLFRVEIDIFGEDGQSILGSPLRQNLRELLPGQKTVVSFPDAWVPTQSGAFRVVGRLVYPNEGDAQDDLTDNVRAVKILVFDVQLPQAGSNLTTEFAPDDLTLWGHNATRYATADGWSFPPEFEYPPSSDASIVLERVLNLRALRSSFLRINQSFDFERTYDGGRVEVSVDGGRTWEPLEPVQKGGWEQMSTASPLVTDPREPSYAWTGRGEGTWDLNLGAVDGLNAPATFVEDDFEDQGLPQLRADLDHGVARPPAPTPTGFVAHFGPAPDPAPTGTPACSDGQDNDGDQKTDHSANPLNTDPQCTGPGDDDERDEVVVTVAVNGLREEADVPVREVWTLPNSGITPVTDSPSGWYKMDPVPGTDRWTLAFPRTLAERVRVEGGHEFLDAASRIQPATPEGSVFVFRAYTDGELLPSESGAFVLEDGDLVALPTPREVAFRSAPGQTVLWSDKNAVFCLPGVTSIHGLCRGLQLESEPAAWSGVLQPPGVNHATTPDLPNLRAVLDWYKDSYVQFKAVSNQASHESWSACYSWPAAAEVACPTGTGTETASAFEASFSNVGGDGWTKVWTDATMTAGAVGEKVASVHARLKDDDITAWGGWVQLSDPADPNPVKALPLPGTSVKAAAVRSIKYLETEVDLRGYSPQQRAALRIDLRDSAALPPVYQEVAPRQDVPAPQTVRVVVKVDGEEDLVRDPITTVGSDDQDRYWNWTDRTAVFQGRDWQDMAGHVVKVRLEHVVTATTSNDVPLHPGSSGRNALTVAYTDEYGPHFGWGIAAVDVQVATTRDTTSLAALDAAVLVPGEPLPGEWIQGVDTEYLPGDGSKIAQSFRDVEDVFAVTSEPFTNDFWGHASAIEWERKGQGRTGDGGLVNRFIEANASSLPADAYGGSSRLVMALDLKPAVGTTTLTFNTQYNFRQTALGTRIMGGASGGRVEVSVDDGVSWIPLTPMDPTKAPVPPAPHPGQISEDGTPLVLAGVGYGAMFKNSRLAVANHFAEDTRVSVGQPSEFGPADGTSAFVGSTSGGSAEYAEGKTHDFREWQPAAFDLTRFAGRDVLVGFHATFTGAAPTSLQYGDGGHYLTTRDFWRVDDVKVVGEVFQGTDARLRLRASSDATVGAGGWDVRDLQILSQKHFINLGARILSPTPEDRLHIGENPIVVEVANKGTQAVENVEVNVWVNAIGDGSPLPRLWSGPLSHFTSCDGAPVSSDDALADETSVRLCGVVGEGPFAFVADPRPTYTIKVLASHDGFDDELLVGDNIDVREISGSQVVVRDSVEVQRLTLLPGILDRGETRPVKVTATLGLVGFDRADVVDATLDLLGDPENPVHLGLEDADGFDPKFETGATRALAWTIPRETLDVLKDGIYTAHVEVFTAGKAEPSTVGATLYKGTAVRPTPGFLFVEDADLAGLRVAVGQQIPPPLQTDGKDGTTPPPADVNIDTSGRKSPTDANSRSVQCSDDPRNAPHRWCSYHTAANESEKADVPNPYQDSGSGDPYANPPIQQWELNEVVDTDGLSPDEIPPSVREHGTVFSLPGFTNRCSAQTNGQVTDPCVDHVRAVSLESPPIDVRGMHGPGVQRDFGIQFAERHDFGDQGVFAKVYVAPWELGNQATTAKAGGPLLYDSLRRDKGWIDLGTLAGVSSGNSDNRFMTFVADAGGAIAKNWTSDKPYDWVKVRIVVYMPPNAMFGIFQVDDLFVGPFATTLGPTQAIPLNDDTDKSYTYLLQNGGGLSDVVNVTLRKADGSRTVLPNGWNVTVVDEDGSVLDWLGPTPTASDKCSKVTGPKKDLVELASGDVHRLRVKVCIPVTSGTPGRSGYAPIDLNAFSQKIPAVLASSALQLDYSYLDRPNLRLAALRTNADVPVDQPRQVTVEVHNTGTLTACSASIGLVDRREGEPDVEVFGANALRPDVGACRKRPDGVVEGGLPPGEGRQFRFVWTPHGAGLHNITALADPANVISELSEEDNEITQTIDVKLPSFPDVVARLAVSDDEPNIGDAVKISLSLTNVGGIAAQSVNVTMKVGVTDLLAGFNEGLVPRIGPGETVWLNKTWRAVFPGKVLLYVNALPRDGVLERVESQGDNLVVQPLFVRSQGLDVTAKVVGVAAAPGEARSVGFIISNNGDTPDAYDLSIEAPRGVRASVFLDGAKVESISLANRTSANLTAIVDLPAEFPAGDVELGLRAVSQNTTQTRVAQFTLSVKALYGFFLEAGQSEAKPGRVEVPLALTNLGNADDPYEVDVVNAPPGWKGVPAPGKVGPYATTTATLVLEIPTTTPRGIYEVLARVRDPVGTEARAVVGVTLLDYQATVPAFEVVRSVVRPSSLVPTTAALVNEGNVRAETSVRVEGPAGWLVAVDRPTLVLDPGERADVGVRVVVPADAAFRSVGQVKLVTTSGGVDRVAVLDVEVGESDLHVLELDYAPRVGIQDGAPVEFTAVVRNDGGLDAHAVGVAFYVDDLLAGYETVGDLAAGGERTVSFRWSADAGEHVVLAILDPGDTVRETDEANNARLEVVRVGRPVGILSAAREDVPGAGVLATVAALAALAAVLARKRTR